MYYIKANLPAVILLIFVAILLWRNSEKTAKLNEVRYKAEKEAIVKELKALQVELKDIRLKSEADSIQRNEVLKHLPNYEKNLSHARLVAIRDSIRARYNMSNR
jgi:predicted RND superfamily exporter protein